MSTKKSFYLLALTCVLATTQLEATPLPKKQVSADAKWLLHLDVDSLRQTKIGSFVLREILEKKVQKQVNNLVTQLNLKTKIDFKKIRAVTAYGLNFESEHSGVLLVHTGQDIQKILETLVQQVEANDGSAPALPLKRLQQSPTPFYSLKDELFASVFSGELLLLGKSREQIEKASQVLAGKSANLTASDAFAAFPNVAHGFFFLAVAEAFNVKDVIPPQAKVLQLAEGGRLVVGERPDNLFAELALRAKSAEVTTQIQQIIQGMVALVSLSQADNQDLMQLAESIKVSTKENLVTILLEYPIAKALKKLEEEVPNLKLEINSPDQETTDQPSKKEAK
jgi:hypothetical protein